MLVDDGRFGHCRTRSAIIAPLEQAVVEVSMRILDPVSFVLACAALAAGLALSPGNARAQFSNTSDPLISPFPEKAKLSDLFHMKALHYSLIPKGKANILFVYGGVEDGATVRFREALDAAKPIDEIWLESPGGSLEDGLEIGRIIHSRKLATHVVKGMQCVSACNFMFMGGVIRYVDPGAEFTVHMFSDGEAEGLRQDLVRPPKTFAALAKRYPTVDVNALAAVINKAFPDLDVTPGKFKAAMIKVRQDAKSVDDDDALDLEAIRQIIADYNRDHPDDLIPESAIIQRVVLDQDVKGIQMYSAQTAASIARFLTEMGMSLKFLTAFASIHNNAARPLTRAELREFNVMNTD